MRINTLEEKNEAGPTPVYYYILIAIVCAVAVGFLLQIAFNTFLILLRLVWKLKFWIMGILIALILVKKFLFKRRQPIYEYPTR